MEALGLVKVSHWGAGSLSFGHIVGIVIPGGKVTKAVRAVINKSFSFGSFQNDDLESKDHSFTSLCNFEHEYIVGA